MKIIAFGKEHDPAQELEILVVPTNPFGLKATITLSDEAPQGWRNEVRRNLTEVHYWFDKSRELVGNGCNQTAFESDIHGTGGTMDNKYIKTIVVEYDTELRDGVYEYESADSDPIWDTIAERRDEEDQASHETASGM